MNQLTSYQRGTLNGTDNGIVGGPTDSQTWGLDALGNFTSVTTNGTAQTRTANQQNEITSISGAGAVTYDANGNTTADGDGNTLVYDAWNRLAAARNGGTTVAAYGYDGLGRRVTETHGTATTDLNYNLSWQVVEERTGGQLQARNVWSPAGVDVLVLRDQSSRQNGVLDQRLYVQQDVNGNVTALVDVHGNVLERYVYQPYGAVTVLAPDWSARGTGAYGWMYLYQGKRYDGWVGLYDSRGRVYLPSLGRPLQADPLGLGPDINYYRWEGNGPTVGSDPTGLWNLWNPLSYTTNNGPGEGWGDVLNPAGTSAHWGELWGAAGTGANDGSRMFVNAATFHQIGSLNDRVNRDIAQNGGLYRAANVSMHVGAYSLEAAVALEAAGADVVIGGGTAAAGGGTIGTGGGAALVQQAAQNEGVVQNTVEDLGPQTSVLGQGLCSTGPRGAEMASNELLQTVEQHGRVIQFAEAGSDDLRYLDTIGANANVGGEKLTQILLREDPRKIEVLEEFLHGTQQRLGLVESLGRNGAEVHVKEFMLRHQKMLGISTPDAEVIKQLLGR